MSAFIEGNPSAKAMTPDKKRPAAIEQLYFLPKYLFVVVTGQR